MLTINQVLVGLSIMLSVLSIPSHKTERVPRIKSTNIKHICIKGL